MNFGLKLYEKNQIKIDIEFLEKLFERIQVYC